MGDGAWGVFSSCTVFTLIYIQRYLNNVEADSVDADFHSKVDGQSTVEPENYYIHKF